MTPSQDSPPIRIANLDELTPGRSVKFRFERDGKNVSAFAANFRGEIIAYENLCRHLPIPLDYANNRFFSADGNHLFCQNHGAIFDPVSGLCLRGPCKGDSLKKLKVTARDGALWLEE